jgi:hypothetical protein
VFSNPLRLGHTDIGDLAERERGSVMGYSCPPVVSVQRIDRGDATKRHLSWGILVDPGVVIAPGPAEWLRDPEVEFEVLIASVSKSGAVAVERIPVRRAEFLGLKSNPSGAAVQLYLVHPSKHRPYVNDDFDDEALQVALNGGADLWTALEISYGVPKGVRERPVDVLDPVVRWERERRDSLVRQRLVDDAGGVVDIICCIWWVCHSGCKDCPEAFPGTTPPPDIA